MSPVSLREAGEGRVEGALRAQAMRDGRKSISSSMLLPFFMFDVKLVRRTKQPGDGEYKIPSKSSLFVLGRPHWGFRKLGVPYLGVLVIRILLFRVLY